MKGLFKNNLYGVIENIKIVFIFILALGTILLITGDSTILSVFSIISAPVIAVVSISCLRKESASEWDKYKLTLPVRRKDIIKSQYVSHLVWSVSGVVLVAVFMVITILLHGNQYFYYGFRDAITLILVGEVLAIWIGAIAYPLYYMWGSERTEVILVISVIGAVSAVLGLSALVNFLTGSGSVSNTEYYISLILIIVITNIVFVLSYYLSNLIFSHKEY